MTDSVAAALRGFGLEARSISSLAGGLESSVWRVDAGGRSFTARRHGLPDADVVHVASELAWLDALAEAGLSLAPAPVRLADGALAPHVERGADGTPAAVWTVLTWVDGEPLGRLPDAREARATGDTVAAMHARASAWSPPPGFSRPRYDGTRFRRAGAELFERAGGALDRGGRAAIEAAVGRACAALDALWATGRRVGMVHADLHDGNLLWSGARTRPAVVDFGRCGLAPLALDLAMAQHYVTPELAEEMLAGYAARAALADDEARALPALRLLAWVENLAVLSRYPAEADGVAADLPLLADQALRLTG